MGIFYLVFCDWLEHVGEIQFSKDFQYSIHNNWTALDNLDSSPSLHFVCFVTIFNIEWRKMVTSYNPTPMIIRIHRDRCPSRCHAWLLSFVKNLNFFFLGKKKKKKIELWSLMSIELQGLERNFEIWHAKRVLKWLKKSNEFWLKAVHLIKILVCQSYTEVSLHCMELK